MENSKTYEYHEDEIPSLIRKAHASFIDQMYDRMDAVGCNRADIARTIQDSATMSVRAFSPQDNITLKTLVRNAMAVGCAVEIKLVPKE